MAHVLVADDETSIADLLREALDLEGYEVRCAGDGVRALELAQAKRPDLIITDVMMPMMRDPDFICAMEQDEALKTVPVIMMSAAPIPDIPDRECDHLQLVRKPFRLSTVLELARQMIR